MPLLTNDKLDEILERIKSGESQAEIAASLKVSTGTLSMFLSSSDEHIERSARARAESAESWLDKGLRVVESALRKDAGIDSNAARAYAQECARRAAIRNPQYRDRAQIEHSGSINKADALSDDELAAVLAARPTQGRGKTD